MAVEFYVPELKAASAWVDHRQAIPGNSFSWAGMQDISRITQLVIHHTVTPRTTHPDDIARMHLSRWGANAGVGYHFLISGSEFSNGYAKVFYVGDLATYRAHVANKNIGRIGISLIGNFEQGHAGYTGPPTPEQLRSAHALVREFVARESKRMPLLTGYDKVVKHKDLQATACPGNTVDQWWNAIIKGEVNVIKLNNGDVFKVGNEAAHWLLEGGKKRAFSSAEAFTEHRYKWEQAKVVDRAQADGIPDGAPVFSRYEHVLNKAGRKTIEQLFVDGDAITPTQLLTNTREQIDKWIITERDSAAKIAAAQKQTKAANDALAKKVAEVATLQKENSTLDTQVEVQAKAIADRDEQIKTLQAKVAELEAQEPIVDTGEFERVFWRIYFKKGGL